MIWSSDIIQNGLEYRNPDTIDDRAMMSNKAFILNSDLARGEGIHWLTIFYDKVNKTTIIIDTLGPKNYRPNDKIMMDKLKQYGRVLFYDGKIQFLKSVWCGWFSVYICKLINNIPEEKRTYDNIIKAIDDKFNMDGLDRKPSSMDEKLIIDSFGYDDSDNTDDDNNEEQQGEGLKEFIQKIIYKSRAIYEQLRKGYSIPYQFDSYMKTIGDLQIVKMYACRELLSKHFQTILKMITLGKAKTEDLYHTSLMVVLSNGQQYVYEKLQQVNIKPFKHSDKIECMQVDMKNKYITLKSMFTDIIERYNKEDILRYDGFNRSMVDELNSYGDNDNQNGSGGSNCQAFVLMNLQAQGLLSDPLYRFIYVDVTERGNSLVKKFAQKITDIKADVDTVIS